MNELAIQQKMLDESAAMRPETEPHHKARLKDACQEFEGMLLSIILKEGMKSTWRDDEERMVGAENMNDFAMEQTAQALGQQGVFGIADMMMAQLERE